MNRFGAFLIHLGISLAIFLVLAAIVVYVWYPGFFFASDGGWQGLRIIVFVDLVLGPLMTLVVFDRRKPELRRDLTIIAAIQLTCLAAGTYIVFQSRPVALVYVDGNFYSMTRGAYQELGVPVPDLGRFPGPWPKRVTVALPEDYIEQSRVRREALQNEMPLRALADRYVAFSFDQVDMSQGFTVNQLEEREDDKRNLEAWLARHDGPPDDFVFFYFGSRYGFTLLGVSKSREAFAGLLADPLAAGG